MQEKHDKKFRPNEEEKNDTVNDKRNSNNLEPTVNEEIPDNWLKANLLGIFDNDKKEIKTVRLATYKERVVNQEPESKEHDDQDNKEEASTRNFHIPKDSVSSLNYTKNQEEGLGDEVQQVERHKLKKKRKKKS